MTKIGYARVSTIDQDFEIQQDRLKAEGCVIVRAEKVSGASREGRTEVATIIEFLREGDELIVTRLDGLGRDTRDVLNIVHECEQRGAFVTILDSHVSTRGEMGQVILTVLGMVAQMERRFIMERQREGINRAKSAGNDLPLNFHPATVRASAAFEPPQDSGPPEAGVFRLRSGRWAGCASRIHQ